MHLSARSLKPAGRAWLLAVAPGTGTAADTSLHPGERDGAATIIQRADILHDRGTNTARPMRLWPRPAPAESRMNDIEITGRSGRHFHPDTGHKPDVLEGRVVVIAGTNTTTATVGDLGSSPRASATATTCRRTAAAPCCSPLTHRPLIPVRR